MKHQIEDETTQSWLKEAQKGYIRIGVLILLNKKPSHGYEIMKEINSRTRGFWQPTPGGVYPILNDLEKSGYIKGTWQTQRNRRLKVYKITKNGQAILKKAIVKQAEIFTNITSLFNEFAHEVLNIPQANVPPPHIPPLFGPFLEDKTKTETLEELEHKRKHIVENMKNARAQLKEINAKIAKTKKETPSASPSDQAPPP